MGLTLDDRFDHESALNVFFRSDQFPFVLHNIPALWWFTGFHPDYHHTTDTVEKIDFAKDAEDSAACVSYGVAVWHRVHTAPLLSPIHRVLVSSVKS